MNRLGRRQWLGGAAATAATAALRATSVHAQKRSPTVRFVAEADLKILDPIWTTAYITRNHGYLVYDTLFGTDENHRIKPQMVDRVTVSPDAMKYTFTLRDSLRWHDGQPVLSEDCVESLKRWGQRDRFGQLLMAHTGRIAPIDKRTFTLELTERFGPVLDALGKPSSNVPFMMPARIASMSPEEQIKEVVGSGPFKFARDEWQPGKQVVYVRNPTMFHATRRRVAQPVARRCTLTRLSGGTFPIIWTRPRPSRRARWTGGRNRPSTSSPRLN